MITLANKTIVITGASRGIGRQMALLFARDGANIAILAKTAESHPKLPGTIYSVAKEVEAAGGKALPLVVDVRDAERLASVCQEVADKFGAIDALVNNAGAIKLLNTQHISPKQLDLLWNVNVRATLLATQCCLPYLKTGNNPHILTISPPINLSSQGLVDYLPYTVTKYGMSLCTLAWSREFSQIGVAANSLWPKTIIATSAISNNFPAKFQQQCRKPIIMAKAAYYILCQESRQCTGNFFTDEQILSEAGEKDFDKYLLNPELTPIDDLYLD